MTTHHVTDQPPATKPATAPATLQDPAPADSVLLLDPDERSALAAATQALTADPRTEPLRFCRQARHAAAAVPPRVRDRLAAFSWGTVDNGHLLIAGLPLPPHIPPTPPDNRNCVAGTTVTSRAQALLNECVGHTLAYEAEGHGWLFQDMVPSRALATSQTSQSSAAELELHTEQAFSPLLPDWISLACLRGQPDALTYLLPARELCAALTADERRALREQRWTTTVDASFLTDGHAFALGTRRGPLAILHGAEDDPFVVFDHDLMRGTSALAELLRERIQEIYQARRIGLSLRPGHMLLVDNRRAMHGRSVFTPRYDGTDRFVSRSFVTADPARTRHARPGNGRTVSAAFS
ncbi:TauD/TfdA family dioxygenase [Actinacidiphila paucisporea]|uniref:Taurine catabolism dioxygenase TauD, TfdA family n=1 Tax=Actinacidiphila paucisporea TaxID=310782 RepID=A0A1M7PQN6_9ACTN|nr:TauD/TfdA family dioxygenase [Actinacidiphila paucisporea]SHN19651.1 Taurine catabolism dioxygenase TauD, TfdA family [Actinacidiphila paucisporea]